MKLTITEDSPGHFVVRRDGVRVCTTNTRRKAERYVRDLLRNLNDA